LRAIEFPGADAREVSSAVPGCVADWHQFTCQALQAILEGRPVLQRPPLDWSGATAFQRAVWEALLTIPAGEVRTYADIARQVGRPRAARAVGTACGANPLPLMVPCHRVVAAGGWLGGFSAGLSWKKKLLQLEGHKIAHSRLVLC
jgi:O-6-methylguanine DNA methyltransferase